MMSRPVTAVRLPTKHMATTDAKYRRLLHRRYNPDTRSRRRILNTLISSLISLRGDLYTLLVVLLLIHPIVITFTGVQPAGASRFYCSSCDHYSLRKLLI